MATMMVPPRTPSPKVRIRAQSFDSPSSRMTITPIEESPCSKSTGAIVAKPFPRHDVLKAAEQGAIRPVSILLPLHTKMSDDSIMSEDSDTSSSVASSPTDSEGDMDLCADSPLPSPCKPRQRPHPLAFAQTIAYDENSVAEPPSPFLYQDPSYPMYSPWLVRVVLDFYDVRGLDWMSIAEPIERIWGVRTSTADVLDILSNNGRVLNRQWWD